MSSEQCWWQNNSEYSKQCRSKTLAGCWFFFFLGGGVSLSIFKLSYIDLQYASKLSFLSISTLHRRNSRYFYKCTSYLVGGCQYCAVCVLKIKSLIRSKLVRSGFNFNTEAVTLCQYLELSLFQELSFKLRWYGTLYCDVLL